MKRAWILGGLAVLALSATFAAPARAQRRGDRYYSDRYYGYGHSDRDHHRGYSGDRYYDRGYYDPGYSGGAYYDRGSYDRGYYGRGYGYPNERDHKAEDRARERRHRAEHRSGYADERRHRYEDREAERRHGYEDRNRSRGY